MVTMDLHSPQIQGFFRIPTDHLHSLPILCEYVKTLDIYSKDRLNLVLDISTALSSTKTPVKTLNARATSDGFAIVHLDILVSDAEQLSTVMRKLHQISGVMKVDRPAG